MSYSRLEKFIYAICSMDVTDLPVPLSRIETLWNCLITGETPDFEPLSRNEKYLMAMLDCYDISNLPAPMSRGEKLLYKIAVGETDLSDVPGYLSRYEELLKYLIENGGISGGDFEYVLHTINQSLYTLYTTAEKPAKSAILKGQTLVNLATLTTTKASGEITSAKSLIKFNFNKSIFVPNKSYTIKIELKINSNTNTRIYYELFARKSDGTSISTSKHIVTDDNMVGTIYINDYRENILPSADTEKYSVDFYIAGGPIDTTLSCSYDIEVLSALFIEGDHTLEDIPYFEGMQSVKMPVLTTTGKNVCDMVGLANRLNEIDNKIVVLNESTWEIISNESYHNSNFKYRPIKFKENTSYTISFEGQTTDDSRTILANIIDIIYTDGVEYHMRSIGLNKLITPTNKTIDYILFSYGVQGIKETISNLSIVEGESTIFEPFKSNILTVNDDVTLRGIGVVQDTLDLITGELTERIGEYQITGEENWEFLPEPRRLQIQNPKFIPNIESGAFACDILEARQGNHNSLHGAVTVGTYYIGYTGDNWLRIILGEDLTSLEQGKEWLKANKPTIQYQLKTESIKTVDLTVVDQDNQPTQLGTFENLTHVSLEAEGLIPEVEMEVATNLLEDTVFTLTDAFNTLYATAEKPVKSAILKGQTLVNLVTQKSGSFNGTRFLRIPLSRTLNSNTNYFIKFNLRESSLTDGVVCRLRIGINGNVVGGLESDGIITVTGDGYNYIEFYIKNAVDVTNGLDGIVDDIMVIEYQDNMENWDIPYFEGMQSVKMPVLTTTGKNLFDGELEYGDINDITGETVENHVRSRSRSKDFIKTIPSASYFMYSDFPSDSTSKGIYVYQYDSNKNYIGLLSNGMNVFNKKFTVADNCYFIKIRTTIVSTLAFNIGVMSDGETYEPYKSNILTVNEDVTLRGIGDVKDELDCLTGEVVRNIGEIVLDGSENWSRQGVSQNNSDLGIYYSTNALPNTIFNTNNVLCDKFKTSKTMAWHSSEEDIYVSISTYGLKICFDERKLESTTVEGFKKWLSENTPTIQYPLVEKPVKTVDLTTVDQDGNETKLRTFDDTTHVLLESEGLIPTASLTVRTKIPSASSTSLLMDDISNEQQQLETTVDEQSNNVDATMIATTEIYEETL